MSPTVATLLRKAVNISKETATDWFSLYREMCMVQMASDDLCMILGDPRLIVEIDESKFEKMKYGRAKAVDGKWVLKEVRTNVTLERLKIVRKILYC